MADSSQSESSSDYDWAVAYGRGGAKDEKAAGYAQQQHQGTVEEAHAKERNADSSIIGAALDRADSGKPTPDSTLRRE